jgi:prevent-host-death family protein
MKTTNIHKAKTYLSQLIQRVERGEEIAIARAGKPVAKLIPYKKGSAPRKPGGSWKGKIRMSKNFDRLPEKVIRTFYGEKE